MKGQASPIIIPDLTGLAPQRERFFARAAGAAFNVVSASDDPVELLIYDEIGPAGVSAAAFKRALNEIGDRDILLKLNSPGGSVFDSLSMYNDLVQHRGDVRIEITGIAASAASIIAMAGDVIAAAKNAVVMIHRSWGATIGNESDHRDTAGILAKIDTAMAKTYAEKTGQPLKSINDMMRAETWFSAGEARAAGFVHEIIGESEPQASWDLSRYRNVPAALKANLSARGERIHDQDQIYKALRDGGMPKSWARDAAAEVWAKRPGQRSQDTSERQSLQARLSAGADELRAILRSN